MSQPQQVEDLLKHVTLFSHLEPRQLSKLARLCIPRQYAPGEVLVKKGDTGLGMWLIISGRMEVFDEQDNHKILLAALGPGDCVGEMSLIDQRARSATVEIVESCQCLLLTRDGFNNLVQRDPKILWSIVPPLVERLRESSRRIAELSEIIGPEADEPIAEPRADLLLSRSANQDASSSLAEDETQQAQAEPADSDRADVGTLALQLLSSSFVFHTSLYFLGAQELWQLLAGKEEVGKRLENHQEVLESLTTRFEENMDETTKKAYDSHQNFLSSLLARLER